MIELLTVTRAHCESIADTVRHPEVEAYLKLRNCSSMAEAIWQSVSYSIESWTCRINGEIVAIGGLKAMSLLSESAEFWFYAGEAIERYSFAFLGALKHWEKELFEKFPRVYGLIDSRFCQSLKLAEWMGFKTVKQADMPELGTHVFFVEKVRA